MNITVKLMTENDINDIYNFELENIEYFEKTFLLEVMTIIKENHFMK